jgi:hypothetical protein
MAMPAESERQGSWPLPKIAGCPIPRFAKIAAAQHDYGLLTDKTMARNIALDQF